MLESPPSRAGTRRPRDGARRRRRPPGLDGRGRLRSDCQDGAVGLDHRLRAGIGGVDGRVDRGFDGGHGLIRFGLVRRVHPRLALRAHRLAVESPGGQRGCVAPSHLPVIVLARREAQRDAATRHEVDLVVAWASPPRTGSRVAGPQRRPPRPGPRCRSARARQRRRCSELDGCAATGARRRSRSSPSLRIRRGPRPGGRRRLDPWRTRERRIRRHGDPRRWAGSCSAAATPALKRAPRELQRFGRS